ncbi:expansin-B18-like [Daucus carota subsp. sativus]|uniref:expansin-B18-like n=1 Tax=Daucus carota subsp. sativus TaxID=79200 RepID=UPI0007EF4894|nr:PREDICTED: expansin-B18-like [Daucus carota subsp. sativus]
MALNLKNDIPISILVINLSVIFMQISLSFGQGFAPALATWYGPPDGPGSGGACGFDTDVAQPPFSSMISAGNAKIFLKGHGCGQCFQVQCSAEQCSGQPITVTITDECPGACNNVPFHFDLSGHAFGAMAKPGQENNLRQLGQVDIQFRRVPCNYQGAKIAFKIDPYINPNYFACAVESINGDGDIGAMQLKPSNSDWIPMQQSWGATWYANISDSAQGPLSFRITTSSGKSIEADNAVPPNWAARARYVSNVNF